MQAVSCSGPVAPPWTARPLGPPLFFRMFSVRKFYSLLISFNRFPPACRPLVGSFSGFRREGFYSNFKTLVVVFERSSKSRHCPPSSLLPSRLQEILWCRHHHFRPLTYEQFEADRWLFGQEAFALPIRIFFPPLYLWEVLFLHGRDDVAIRTKSLVWPSPFPG